MPIAAALIRRVTARAADFIVGAPDSPYLMRWWVIPRNPVLNIYLHRFLRDDDPRAHHDHPWPWCSIILRGQYRELTIKAGGVQRAKVYQAGAVRIHTPWYAHRLELVEDGSECWTLFITGPRMRNWGFHCPNGWRRWQDFTDPAKPGQIGRGCEG